MLNDYKKIATQYAKIKNTGTTFLAFNPLPKLLKKYVHGKKVLDYGCGTGAGTAFLIEQGLDVVGVDINPIMLEEAKKELPSTPFIFIDSAKIPYPDEYFNLVFSSFVLFEISTIEKMAQVFNQIYRVLKPGGVFIAITGTTEMYQHEWLSIDVNFSENCALKSGDIAKVLLKEENIVVYDYYWTDTDYQQAIQESPFVLQEILRPLGTEKDGYLWKEEKNYPPYVIYVLKKEKK